jgi:hypothetical protein
MRKLLPTTLLLTTMLLLTMFAVPGMGAQRMGFASSRFGANYNRTGRARAFSYPFAFSDPFYSDYLSSTGYPAASQPPVIILQTPPADFAPERASSPTSGQPLMIELRGDRYVRVDSEEMSDTPPISSKAIDSRSAPGRQLRSSNSEVPQTAAKELPGAVLVFRDSHREEISEYTIADGVLYTRADYYTSGSWNRKIELSSLNLPETLKSNQSRGVRFQLPAASNEVTVGP